MKLIDPSIEIITPLNGEEILKHVEKAIRNCYRSDDKICDGSSNKLVKTILDSHHQGEHHENNNEFVRRVIFIQPNF